MGTGHQFRKLLCIGNQVFRLVKERIEWDLWKHGSVKVQSLAPEGKKDVPLVIDMQNYYSTAYNMETYGYVKMKNPWAGDLIEATYEITWDWPYFPPQFRCTIPCVALTAITTHTVERCLMMYWWKMATRMRTQSWQWLALRGACVCSRQQFRHWTLATMFRSTSWVSTPTSLWQHWRLEWTACTRDGKFGSVNAEFCVPTPSQIWDLPTNNTEWPNRATHCQVGAGFIDTLDYMQLAGLHCSTLSPKAQLWLPLSKGSFVSYAYGF